VLDYPSRVSAIPCVMTVIPLCNGPWPSYSSYLIPLPTPDYGMGSYSNSRYDDTGFKINNVKYEGSVLIVENKIMTWAPKTFSEITPER
jgi:hypothetical protein